MKTKPVSKNCIHRSHGRSALLLVPLMLVSFALSPTARAVCQEGCLTSNNTVLGEGALLNNTGVFNTAVGFNALFSNTTGGDNTAIGSRALFSNTTGESNTANGFEVLFNNTTGTDNTANGFYALRSNTTDGDNTATGDHALFENTTGGANTANGSGALFDNTTGNYNTATGFAALSGYLPSTGNHNTAIGFYALLNNTTGNYNTASGSEALLFNYSGVNNTASGFQALENNTTGNGNIAIGFLAGNTLVSGSNNIYVGNAGSSSNEQAKIRIGSTGTQRATFIAGISGVTVPAGVGVIVGTDGKLGTVVSSERFKDSIKPMDKASEAILALKPVTFHYKHELDPEAIPQFGLVAEEVEKVNPDLVARDEQGKPYTVRYEAVNAMLLNEFLKEHRKVEQLEATVANLVTTVKEQASEMQKFRAQLEASKSAPQVVNNP